LFAGKPIFILPKSFSLSYKVLNDESEESEEILENNLELVRK